jgi:SpoVK/Ycf46/Vps4 family AAA+-type ATPase
MLSNAVVLFDEVEEFVRDRDDNELPPASKMITTSMLSLIQDLRRRKNVLFIVTTNFLKNFDSAITRAGGRFDMVLLVPPPSIAEKIRMFHEKLAAYAAKAGDPQLRNRVEEHNASFKQFVETNKVPIEYFAFSEWSSYVDELIKRIANPQTNTQELFSTLLSERKDGITIREGLRDDYDNSKTMARIW